jgi:hypothetical protein
MAAAGGDRPPVREYPTDNGVVAIRRNASVRVSSVAVKTLHVSPGLSAVRLSSWQLHVQSAPGASLKLFYFNETVQQTVSNFFVASAKDNADGAQNRKSALKRSLAAPFDPGLEKLI